MARKKKRAEIEAEGGKRFTIEFNAHHRELIETKVEAESLSRGYPVTVSDLFRELVDAHLVA